MTREEENEQVAEGMRAELYGVLKEALVGWMRKQRHTCHDNHGGLPCPAAVAAITALAQLTISHAIGALNFDEDGVAGYVRDIYRMMAPTVIARRLRAGVAMPKVPTDIN